MFWNFWVGLAAAMLSTGELAAAAAADASVYQDPETGFTFSQYAAAYNSNGASITFRIAVPSGVQSYTPYDAVLQVVAPNDVGWAGLAWGGSMISNPLMACWKGYSNNVLVSSRWAKSHTAPTAYTGSTYQVFRTGTKTNSTHWQFTAKCTGCTSYQGDSGGMRYLSAQGGNRLAFAYSPTKPSNPSSNTSSFGVHEVIGYWNHDFSSGANPSFTSLVSKLSA
ncbi:hypothetical protein QBC46DRAFT_443089 [Diplogelasinospora grovesii]|uniref:Cellobiose dehydrogenase-like cytochrome domain-containing protein n=1 Tax=Diplogelasinospora grovesii TaxID=303347 RepID=A0AAN6S211_9PEZI|nr:hypothetical protein QBC46DRAFT_443089 [Diplogelasinospora grovesii]